MLGLHFRELGHRTLVIGAVYRGRTALDGVLSAICPQQDVPNCVVKLIKSSKHFGQIRIMVLDEETFSASFSLDVNRIHGETNIPVIYLRRGDSFDPLFMTKWRERVIEPVGINEKSTARIMKMLGEEPMVLQVAQLISRNLVLMQNV